MRAARFLSLLALMPVLAAPSCMKRASESPADYASTPVARAAQAGLKEALEAGGAPVAQVAQGVLIKHGSVTLIVGEAAGAEARLQALMKEFGAFVAARESHASVRPGKALGPSEVRGLTLTIKVDAKRFDDFLVRVKEVGSYVTESVSTEDVTLAHADLGARLANQRRLEERLLGHLADPARDVKLVLEIEKELARVREQIETLAAQLRVMEDRIAYSTLEVTLSVQPEWVPPEEVTFGDEVAAAAKSSMQALGLAARFVAVAWVAVLPWLAVLAVVGLLVWIPVRLARKRRSL
jgi:hypothetical protein